MFLLLILAGALTLFLPDRNGRGYSHRKLLPIPVLESRPQRPKRQGQLVEVSFSDTAARFDLIDGSPDNLVAYRGIDSGAVGVTTQGNLIEFGSNYLNGLEQTVGNGKAVQVLVQEDYLIVLLENGNLEAHGSGAPELPSRVTSNVVRIFPLWNKSFVVLRNDGTLGHYGISERQIQRTLNAATDVVDVALGDGQGAYLTKEGKIKLVESLGKNIPEETKNQLEEIDNVVALACSMHDSAFLALRSDRTLKAWGWPDDNPLPEEIRSLSDIDDIFVFKGDEGGAVRSESKGWILFGPKFFEEQDTSAKGCRLFRLLSGRTDKIHGPARYRRTEENPLGPMVIFGTTPPRESDAIPQSFAAPSSS